MSQPPFSEPRARRQGLASNNDEVDEHAVEVVCRALAYPTDGRPHSDLTGNFRA